jgi:hypothetical protein
VLRHLDGRKLAIPCDGEVTAHGAVRVVRGEGMQRRGNSFEKGTCM